MRAARLREIRHHAPGIVRDEVRRRVRAPVAPAPTAATAAPSTPPTHPEWPDAIDCHVLGDLKILSTVGLAPGIVALMVPETPLELFQLNTVGLPPDGVDPVPVPIVVQPTAIVARIGIMHFPD
jgi:hypothetical protein